MLRSVWVTGWPLGLAREGLCYSQTHSTHSTEETKIPRSTTPTTEKLSSQSRSFCHRQPQPNRSAPEAWPGDRSVQSCSVSSSGRVPAQRGKLISNQIQRIRGQSEAPGNSPFQQSGPWLVGQVKCYVPPASAISCDLHSLVSVVYWGQGGLWGSY